MKIKHLFMAVLACAAFAACEQENPVTGDQVADKDQAYLSINFINADAVTKGTSDGFENGIQSENDVKTVEFYFYNADGSQNQYVSKALSWNVYETGANIEKFANATVVLTDLKEKGTPKYVVAVLNGPVAEYKGKTLAELKALTVNAYTTDGYFMMTNSTYNNGDANSQYFATVLEYKNFLNEKPNPDQLTDDNDVEIYVERVAVKVAVTIGESLGTSITLANYEVDGTTKDLKINLLGWGLNAINKTSYVEKNVPEWSYDLKGTVANTSWPNADSWSDATNFRSYWAKSPNYGANSTYPLSYGQEDDGDNVLKTLADGTALNYVSWESLDRGFTGNTGYTYCLENTNTSNELLSGNFYAKATHVLLKAQIEGAKDLVRYDGQLFTETGFINRVLGQLNMSAFKVTTSGESTTYTQIEAADIKIKDLYDGDVSFELTEAGLSADWSSTTGTDTELTTTELNEMLKNLVDAEYYESGMMYYCIPIEHLRGGKFTIAASKNSVAEADYGVVRNHYYKLTINKIENLGTSVYHAEEQIVPNLETPTYYVGASINILAWHVVNQDVEL